MRTQSVDRPPERSSPPKKNNVQKRVQSSKSKPTVLKDAIPETRGGGHDSSSNSRKSALSPSALSPSSLSVSSSATARLNDSSKSSSWSTPKVNYGIEIGKNVDENKPLGISLDSINMNSVDRSPTSNASSPVVELPSLTVNIPDNKQPHDLKQSKENNSPENGSLLNPNRLSKTSSMVALLQGNRKKMLSFYINHYATQAFLALALLTSLFLPDLWTISNPANEWDNILNGILVFFLLVFLLEMVILSFAYDEYFLSTFFWMDMVGTLSILIDFTWTSDNRFISSNTDPGNLRLWSLLRPLLNSLFSLALTYQTARVAKLGARVSRMSKLSKILKYFHFTSKKNDNPSLEINHFSAKKISAKMGLILSQRVALLIMTVIICLPLLTPIIIDFSGSGFLLSFDQIAQSNSFNANEWSNSVFQFRKFYDIQKIKNDMTIFEPVWLKIRNITENNCPLHNKLKQKNHKFSITSSYEQDKQNDYFCLFSFRNGNANNGIIRKQNKRFATSLGHGRYFGDKLCSPQVPEFAYTCNHLLHVDALFDNTLVAIEDAWYSVGIIFMVAILLVGFTATFQYAVEDLVVKPIARIMAKLATTANEVMLSYNTLSSDGHNTSKHLGGSNSHSSSLDHKPGEEEEEDEDNNFTEADMVEKAVDKLSRMVSKAMGSKHNMLHDQSVVSSSMDKKTKDWLRHDYSFQHHPTNHNQESENKTIKEDNDGLNMKNKKKTIKPQRKSLGLHEITIDINTINSFEFDVLKLDEFSLCDSVSFMFERFNLLNEFQINKEIFDEFLHQIRKGYIDDDRIVKYHTWLHGCDVLQFVYQLINITKSFLFLNKIEIFSCLIAALGHDIGHFGLNNQFLIQTNHELAELHNDVSPLENMHIRLLFNIIKNPNSNIMSGLTKLQMIDARKQIIICILNTDMAFHFDNLKKLEVFEEVNGQEIIDFLFAHNAMENVISSQENEITTSMKGEIPRCFADRNNRLLFQQSFIHAADLNNPVKKYKIYHKWVNRIVEEFFVQGEKEAQLGMDISPNFDRENTSIPSMQIGFIEVIIRPYFNVFFKLFPNILKPLEENMERNFQHFKKMRAHEKEGGVAI